MMYWRMPKIMLWLNLQTLIPICWHCVMNIQRHWHLTKKLKCW
nr:MAG TPA: hypothetical protein [Caudoviricetes sp.]